MTTNDTMGGERKVDVLAVLDKHIKAERALGYEASAREGEEARAAMAELIDVCWYISAHAKPDEWMRFHAALARIGGTA